MRLDGKRRAIRRTGSDELQLLVVVYDSDAVRVVREICVLEHVRVQCRRVERLRPLRVSIVRRSVALLRELLLRRSGGGGGRVETAAAAGRGQVDRRRTQRRRGHVSVNRRHRLRRSSIRCGGGGGGGGVLSERRLRRYGTRACGVVQQARWDREPIECRHCGRLRSRGGGDRRSGSEWRHCRSAVGSADGGRRLRLRLSRLRRGQESGRGPRVLPRVP